MNDSQYLLRLKTRKARPMLPLNPGCGDGCGCGNPDSNEQRHQDQEHDVGNVIDGARTSETQGRDLLPPPHAELRRKSPECEQPPLHSSQRDHPDHERDQMMSRLTESRPHGIMIAKFSESEVGERSTAQPHPKEMTISASKPSRRLAIRGRRA